MRTLLLLTLALLSAPAFAEPSACDIEQTSDGDYGVREYRTSGWVYLVRGLSIEQAQRALENLQASGRCQ